MGYTTISWLGLSVYVYSYGGQQYHLWKWLGWQTYVIKPTTDPIDTMHWQWFSDSPNSPCCITTAKPRNPCHKPQLKLHAEWPHLYPSFHLQFAGFRRLFMGFFSYQWQAHWVSYASYVSKIPQKVTPRHDSSMTRLDSLGLDCQDATRNTRHFRETLSLLCLEHWLSPGLEAETVMTSWKAGNFKDQILRAM